MDVNLVVKSKEKKQSGLALPLSVRFPDLPALVVPSTQSLAVAAVAPGFELARREAHRAELVRVREEQERARKEEERRRRAEQRAQRNAQRATFSFD